MTAVARFRDRLGYGHLDDWSGHAGFEGKGSRNNIEPELLRDWLLGHGEHRERADTGRIRSWRRFPRSRPGSIVRPRRGTR